MCLPLLSHGADYRFGVFAGSASKDNQSELREEFKPLADYLAKETGSNIKLEISQSFKNMERRLNNASRFALLLAPAQVTADAIEDGYNPVAKWNKPLYGLFVIAVDKPYGNIAALKGARLGLASRDTAVGPLCMDSLSKTKLRTDRDFASVYEGKFMDVLTKELKTKSLDAICISPIAWKTLNAEAPGAFKVLGETARIPGFAFSLDNALSTQEKKSLTAVLASIGAKPEGKAALAAITGSASGATATLPASSAEYTNANRLLEQGKQLYDQQMPK
ncbi:PhnD/SsuA/transferrin family substrate-binding protein [Thiobacillus sp.]|uniref:phosphate/phosphite/phosphonate ABC transporter substrate-binding protein n=1 Tax=Thiobacillus sp. TaxID=924 RepID=UPI0025D61192|nr:PhnD/SsuA/transferrin family substrate-binding protein [Thiobacillus sp.]MBT9539644.1 PhnD/SsuA/transferrin family substrate-binding protein [Thiobacillus sp.]